MDAYRRRRRTELRIDCRTESWAVDGRPWAAQNLGQLMDACRRRRRTDLRTDRRTESWTVDGGMLPAAEVGEKV